MMRPQNSEEWLAGFVVPDAPRGDEALALARALVDALGSPQRHAPAVHIVGTAGKGAVAERLTARLVAGGIGVATHQSPHVYDFRERFLINGEMPAWSAVDTAIEEVDAAVAEVRASAGRAPTFFAVTAALSWVLGRQHDVDVFVTEAGIGGRVDATAVLDRPDTITVITHIGLDHTDVLGSTIEAITGEKVAVMAGRRLAVLGPQSSNVVRRVVGEVSAAHSVELVEVGPVDGDWRAHADAIAEAASTLLAPIVGRRIPVAPLESSPGRLEERVVVDRLVILDGAHNPLKLNALHEALGDREPAVVIAAVGAGKDLAGCAAAIASFGAPVLAVEFGGEVGPRSRPAEAVVAAVTDAGGSASVADNPVDAVTQARGLTVSGDTILVTGSFLILSDIASAFAAADGD